MGEIRSGQKLELVELIYAAGLDPAGWETVVARLGELLPHAAIAFQLIDLLQKSPAICLVQNWEDGARALEAYTSHFAAISPWVPAHRAARVGVPYVAERICPVSSYRSSEFYADFVEPYKVKTGAVAVKLFDDVSSFATVSMNYDEHKTDVVLEPMEQLLRELSPHLRRAIEMNRKFAELEVRSQSMEGLLDRTPFPVLLVTGDATVRHLNEPAARAIEGRRGVLIAPPGRLAFARPDETAKLRRMIQESAGLASDSVDGFMTFTAPGEPDPNMAWISPLVPKSDQALLRLVASGDREVLVTLQYREDEVVIPQERLKSAFDFTEAESQVVLALAKGESLADHAEITRRSVHTVRLHLKRALSKAGCHSQSELVALVWRTIGQPI